METFLKLWAWFWGLVSLLFILVIVASFGAFILEIMSRAYQ